VAARLTLALALLSLAHGVAQAADPGQCVDEGAKADLLAKRRRRGVQDRLFQKTNRHEITAWGGYYVSDLFDGTYVVGGAYTYHMTEDFAVEASGGYSHFRSSGGPELERTFSVLGGKSLTVALFDALLVWAPLHAKMRLFAGSIVHFDLFFAGGTGIVDSALSTGVAGTGGLGMAFTFGRAYALRIDIRDHVYKQQLLPRSELVNDLTTTLGMSVFLPLGE
jgi:outer membrane beta-barrel protein